MSRIVAVLGKQFGGFGADPAVPTLTVVDNEDSTATATISGSSADSTNVVWTQLIGSGTWVNSGNRTGDGNVTLALSPGRYYVYVRSTRNSQQANSNVEVLHVTDGSLLLQDLDHSPAQIVSQLLIDLGIGIVPTPGATTAWQTYYAQEPTSPDSVITVYDTSGELEGVTLTDGEVQEHYGLQFRFRAADHAAGYAKANSICIQVDQMVSLETVMIDSSQYIVYAITRRGGILALGKEMPSQGSQGMVSKRNVFVFNAVVALRKTN